MRRAVLPIFGLGCMLALWLFCYKAVLFGDEQFAYRDAGHFYYPLYLRVQQEWKAGRLPLWDSEENAGVPLLANPAAAVLYPGKLVFAVLPYAWAMRAYTVAHTVLAFAGVVAVLRAWGTSGVGSGLAGLSYAFGAPILFQYCNVIFLVGAAWVPWGFLALDRLLRLGRRTGLIGLALVLTLQVLGGDPEAAYLTALCGLGYAVVLRLPGGWRGLTAALLGLAGACSLALLLAAVQVLPTWEFSSLSSRSIGRAPMNPLHFSMEPWRVLEAIWPNVFGLLAPENRSWLQAVPPMGQRAPWVMSLYMGGFSIALALGAFGLRGQPPWRAWLSAVVVVSFVASLGHFAGPLWWLRWIPSAQGALGPHDPLSMAPRTDGFFGDGFASPYGLLAALVPGFASFRYPGKLVTFTALANSALAGLGWDLVVNKQTRRPVRWCLLGLVVSAALLALLLAAESDLASILAGRVPTDPVFGPVDAPAALSETRRGIVQGGVVLALGLALAIAAPRRRSLAGCAALLLMTLDLGLANARLIWTAPQADFDAEPLAARLIAAAERDDPAIGPFRIHRLPIWFPAAFVQTRSPGRVHEFLVWERDTLRPFHTLPLGLSDSAARATLELDDYQLFFDPQMLPVQGDMARTLGVADGKRVVYYPRRGLDLWNTRYFIVPAGTHDWASPTRGFAALLPDADRVFPDRGHLAQQGPGSWSHTQDWQMLRSNTAFPRAWVVHSVKVHRPIIGRRLRSAQEDDRLGMMAEMLTPDDSYWSNRGRFAPDLHRIAYVESDEPALFDRFAAPEAGDATESVKIEKHEPQRVELTAVLSRPGLVILADTYYPGWELTIDGLAAPIVRTNRMMRGASVRSGTHRLVYTYKPVPFRIGLVLSVFGCVCLLILVGLPKRV